MATPNKVVAIFKKAKPLDVAIMAIGFMLVIYQMVYVPTHFQNTILLRNNHLLGVMLLVCLGLIKKRPNRWLIYTLLMVGAAAPLVYVQIFYIDIELRNYMLNPLDLVLGTMLIVVVLVAGYMTFGWVLSSVAIVLIAYSFLGFLAPGAFGIPRLSFDRIISWLSLGFSGIYGIGLKSSAEFIFLFIIFGSLLQRTGGIVFFLEFAKLLAGRLRGGVGQTAVISSGFVGMVTGSAMGNVVMTGVYTIPAMKRAGYKPKTAGAIEPVASSGGQLYPPIMGAGAFLMSAFLGIPYLTIVVAAIIPSLLYFTSAFVAVELVSRQQGIKSQKQKVDYGLMWPRIPLFVIPVVVIVLILVQGLSAMWAGFGAIITLLVVSQVIKQTRISPFETVKALAQGASEAAVLGVACAVIGPIIETVSFSGLDIKLPSMIETWGMGNLLLSAVITAAICVLLGFGMPTAGAYITVALMAGPALHAMGLSYLQAHFFVFYWAILSGLTPPVAAAVIPGASLAGSKYLETCWEAVKIGLPAFFVPFLFLYNPILLGSWSGQPVPWIIGTVLASLLGIVPLIAGYMGYYFVSLGILERLVLILSAAGMWGYVATGNYLYLVVGVVIFAGDTLYQWMKMKSAEKAVSEASSTGPG